jgi:hypothetical protein
MNGLSALRCFSVIAICTLVQTASHVAGASRASLTPLQKACVAAIASGDQNLTKRLDRSLLAAPEGRSSAARGSEVVVTMMEQANRRLPWTLTCQFGSNFFSAVPYLISAADWPEFCDCAAMVFDQEMLEAARAAVRRFWSSTNPK